MTIDYRSCPTPKKAKFVFGLKNSGKRSKLLIAERRQAWMIKRINEGKRVPHLSFK